MPVIFKLLENSKYNGSKDLKLSDEILRERDE